MWGLRGQSPGAGGLCGAEKTVTGSRRPVRQCPHHSGWQGCVSDRQYLEQPRRGRSLRPAFRCCDLGEWSPSRSLVSSRCSAVPGMWRAG